MFRKTIHVDSASDPAQIAAALRAECVSSRVAPEDIERILLDVSETVEALVRRGREVAGTSGQFRATKNLSTEVCAVRIVAEFGTPPPGFLARVARLVGIHLG